MIKEIALRKLASDEGINPYGVGALGAVGLTGFGYSPLFNKPFKDLDNKYNRAYNAMSKTEKSLDDYKKPYYKTWGEILRRNEEMDDIKENFHLVPDKDKPSVKARLDMLDSEIAGLEERKKLLNPEKHIDRLEARGRRLKNIFTKLSDKEKRLRTLRTPIAIGTQLIAPVAAIGLGGKYLYDKLTD